MATAQTDILTQLQTCYTQLLNQFFCTLSYLSQRHPTIAPNPTPGDPYTNHPVSPTTSQPSPYALSAGPEDTDPSRTAYPLRSDSPTTFAQSESELAEDLVLKAQQIEDLIARLPGIGKTQTEQAEEIEELAARLREVEERRKEKRKEVREVVKRLDDVVLGMRTSIKY